MIKILKKYPKLKGSKLVNEIVRSIINLLVNNLIENSSFNIKNNNIESFEDVRNFSGLIIGFSKEIKKSNIELKKFLYANLYKHPDVEKMTNRANLIIEKLFSYYNEDISLLPKEYFDYNVNKINAGFKERVICDYIAGMTDRFAQQEYSKLSKSI